VASRRLPVMLVILVSQVAGLVLGGVLVATVGGDAPSARRIIYGAAAGASGFVGLIAFYTAMKVGAMGVITPITATAVLVPVAVGLIHGERPSGLQGAGVAIALAGVVVASIEPEREVLHDRRIAAGVGFALIAALAFGSSLVGLNAAAKGSPIWATFSMRITAVPLGLAFVLAMRVPLHGSLRHWPLLAGVGLADTGANILFGLAGNRGLLSVVAVLASLYPVIVVVLARLLLSERLALSQLGGAAAALAGVALISAG
jgi:drug/metabolite transporter (DMT)-like permease